MTISEKVAYLKGLAEGLDLDTTKSKEGKLISVMIGIMEEPRLRAFSSRSSTDMASSSIMPIITEMSLPSLDFSVSSRLY